MNRFATAIAAVSFTLAAGFATAQMSQGGPERQGGPDRHKMREGMKAAHEACKDKPDRRACMTETMCAKSPDVAKCVAGAKERHAHMSKLSGPVEGVRHDWLHESQGELLGSRAD